MVVATAVVAQLCYPNSPPPQAFESLSARLVPTLSGFTSAISGGLSEELCFPPSWVPSSVGHVASRRTHYREGDRRRPNIMMAEVYEQHGRLPPPQQQRGEFPRPPVILWKKDLANAVQLIGRVKRDIEIKYLDSGKVAATTSLAVGHKGSDGTEDDPSWFMLEIWDDLAEIAVQYVTKGDLVLVSGMIVVDTKYDVPTVKVVVRDICFVELCSDRRKPHGQSNDESMVRGFSSLSQTGIASMQPSQLNWNQQQPSTQPSQGAFGGFQGARGNVNNIAQQTPQSPQTRAGTSKWRDAAKNWNLSHKVVGGFESRQHNTDSSNVKLKRVGDVKANLTRSITATAVLKVRESESLSREEEGKSSHISDARVTENPVRREFRTEGQPRKALWMDGRPSSPWMKAGPNMIPQGRLQSRDIYGSRDLSQDTAQGNGSTHMHSAGTTSQAIAVLQNRLQRGLTIDSNTYIKVLQMCLKQNDLFAAKQVHAYIIQSGKDKNVYVAGTLLNLYIKCGALTDARRVFDQLEKKTVVAWTNMIAGYVKSDRAESALELFNKMRQEGVEPNEITYLSILKACTSPLALQWGKEIHDRIRHAGFELDARVGTALLKMYADCGSIKEASQVFEKLANRDVMTWTVMIGGLAQHGCGHDAYLLFCQMRQEGFEPNAFTYASILTPSANAGTLEWVKEVHSHAIKAGLESDLRVGNALVHIYAESGSIYEAQRVFERMKKRNLVTWTVMISGLAKQGCGQEAYRLFCQMRRDGFEPDSITYLSILNASASAGSLDWVKKVHGHAHKAGLELDLRVGTALVHTYAESGSIDDARRVFDRMEKRDVVTWTVMIGGLAQHGCGNEALELFRIMTADGVKPNSHSFVALLSACCHGGLVDDGRRLFAAMSQDYGIEPDIVHYTCMVDLLGRAGHLEEAVEFINRMPIEPTVVTWRALLGACRSYGNVELGELAANAVFKLDPSNTAPYVLLSNIYAAAGKWENVSLVRTVMQTRGVRKEPGRSWIEVDKKIHEFVVGDTSHPEAKAIYTELNKLIVKLKAEGYMPDTRLVLHDMNEVDKELALCSHSEKLAIAYGLIHIPREEPIRVTKNLRVCSDCHTATKLISKVTGRKIIARDANRFHHFSDGVCSCGDYW